MSQDKSNRYSKKQKRQNRGWLPILIAFGGLLVVGLAFMALRDKPAPAAVEVADAPSLKVDQEKIDLGDMKFNQVAEVSFQITNVGDQTLQFTKDPYIEVAEGC